MTKSAETVMKALGDYWLHGWMHPHEVERYVDGSRYETYVAMEELVEQGLMERQGRGPRRTYRLTQIVTAA